MSGSWPMPFLCIPRRAMHGLVSMRSLPSCRCRSPVWPQRLCPDFLPPSCRRSPRTKKVWSEPSSASLRAFGCGAVCLPARPAHRGRDWRGPEVKGTHIMAKIGSFKKVSGELRGQIVTLSVQAKSVRIVTDEQASGNAPSHRVYVGDTAGGAAWSKRTSADRHCISVKPDDPRFVAHHFTHLFAG